MLLLLLLLVLVLLLRAASLARSVQEIMSALNHNAPMLRPSGEQSGN